MSIKDAKAKYKERYEAPSEDVMETEEYPDIKDCIEGSYKEGFQLVYKVDHDEKTVTIDRSSLGEWSPYFDGISTNIERDLQTYHGYKVIWE